MAKKTRADILKDKKARIRLVIKLIKSGIYNKYDLHENLKKERWYSEVTPETIQNYIREGKNIAKSRISNDFILNSSFVFDELKEMYEDVDIDAFTRLKVLQEMAKVQGLYDVDLKKQLLYRDELGALEDNEDDKNLETLSEKEIREKRKARKEANDKRKI